MSAHTKKFGLPPNAKARRKLDILRRRVDIIRWRIENQPATGAHGYYAAELAALEWVLECFDAFVVPSTTERSIGITDYNTNPELRAEALALSLMAGIDPDNVSRIDIGDGMAVFYGPDHAKGQDGSVKLLSDRTLWLGAIPYPEGDAAA